MAIGCLVLQLVLKVQDELKRLTTTGVSSSPFSRMVLPFSSKLDSWNCCVDKGWEYREEVLLY